MNKLEIGDTAYTFIGEKLCKIKITEFLDKIRVCASNKDETYCVYKKYCYPSKEEAIEGMRKAIS